MCIDEARAVSGQAHEFRPTKIFFFFSWGETRRVSPHALAASRLRIAIWSVAVGRNGLSFAPGVGQNCFQVGRNSLGTSRQVCQMSKIPPPTFGHLMRFGFVQPLRFAAVTGAQNSWVWVLRMCRDLETGCDCARRRAPLAQSAASADGYSLWLKATRSFKSGS